MYGLGILDDPALTEKLPQAFLETLSMVAWSGAATVVLGIPLGLALHTVSPVGLRPQPRLYRPASALVNVAISLPFVMLVTLALPLIRLAVGSASGWQATVIPLTVATFPFLARLVEISLRSVPRGTVEAGLLAGASPGQIALGIQLRESRSRLVADVTVAAISLISYSALVGVVGGGGLGYLAISYGYNRFQTEVMIVTLLVIIAFVQVVQILGTRFAARLDPAHGSGR
ncbi:methionine ABC transporter permease [Propionibacterium freudenreichii]|uniref:methionine ABC transporter permease n=1 Tax=Propionibacterium freudenreichii TaxID=1744 RepID=UPI0005A5C9FB|nr:methionine ABC transporter permease [Propionibacterium freudenreichii]MDN6429880.1 ABC transporter permease [Propionibacterium sp.]MDK9344309.1 ABC transporter permease [Propionibacterium freudenreichii]MDK9349739.1 ABC transporter permease [Propionibacterium freudenreichii]MDK9628276.1 ABC transporter permease [Propionibacterium freudenreichii]MDK9653635.1 ABC transporter permease [Propionibacterium freudenreichii]